LNVVQRSWRNYDPETDSGEIFVECPSCELVEEFSSMIAAEVFEKIHLNSPSHVRRYYFSRG